MSTIILLTLLLGSPAIGASGDATDSERTDKPTIPETDSPQPAPEELASAAELDRFLEAWADAMRDPKPLEIHFKQEKRLRILKRPLVSRGTIRLVAGKLLCEVKDRRGRLESATLVDGDELQVLYPRLKRLETYELGRGRNRAEIFPVFGADPAAVKREFEVALYVSKSRGSNDETGDEGEGAVHRRLALKPRDPDHPLAALTLLFEGFEVQEVEQRDRRGDSVRLILEKTLEKPQLRASDLELDIPPGTREVRPTAGRSSRG